LSFQPKANLSLYSIKNKPLSRKSKITHFLTEQPNLTTEQQTVVAENVSDIPAQPNTHQRNNSFSDRTENDSMFLANTLQNLVKR
jgi:hypothetical protein